MDQYVGELGLCRGATQPSTVLELDFEAKGEVPRLNCASCMDTW